MVQMVREYHPHPSNPHHGQAVGKAVFAKCIHVFIFKRVLKMNDMPSQSNLTHQPQHLISYFFTDIFSLQKLDLTYESLGYLRGKYLTIARIDRNPLELAEIRVYGSENE